MSGEKRVKVILNGKEQRRIKLPRPDIGEVEEAICSRFGVRPGISLVAIVPEGGRQEEYMISSSDDLQDLWEDFRELHVTDKQIDAGKITLTEGLRVIFNNDRADVKLITFDDHDIEAIKNRICERFSAENVSLVAVIEGDSDKYSITTNDDVREMWKSRIVELQVTGKKKRLDIDMSVAINRESYSIDVVPHPRTAVVRTAQQELGVIDNMMEVDKSFRRMGNITNISYYAAVATGNHDLQLGTKNLGFSAIELCHAADNTVQSYVITCGTVNETLHTTIIYLLENDYDRALRMISSLEGTAQECTVKTKKLIYKIDKVCESKVLSNETRLMIMNERKKAEEFEKEQEKKELELQHVRSQLMEPTRPGPVKSFFQKVGSNVFRAANVVAGAVTSSAPKFLISAGRGLLGFAADKEEDEEKKKDEERKRQEKQRKKKQDAEKHKLQLSLDLKDLQRDIQEAKESDRCLHILGGELLKMRSDLVTMKSFFEELLLFCQAIKKSEEQIMANMGPGQKAEGGEVKKVNCKDLFETRGFKEQLVNYQAKWVAIKEVCLECRSTLGKTKRELHAHIERNPTKEEARRDIDGMIYDMTRTL